MNYSYITSIIIHLDSLSLQYFLEALTDFAFYWVLLECMQTGSNMGSAWAFKFAQSFTTLVAALEEVEDFEILGVRWATRWLYSCSRKRLTTQLLVHSLPE